MNLNKPMTLGKTTIPGKQNINLMMRDKEGVKLQVLIPAVLVGVLLIGLFCKFAVIDRIFSAYRAESEAASLELQVAAADEALKNYDEVEEEYARYFSGALTDTDMPRSGEEIMSLIERRLLNSATVSSLSFSGSTVSLQLSVARLDNVSGIIEALNAEPAVDSVAIYTAANTDGSLQSQAEGAAADKEATIIMTITLKGVD